MRQSAAWICALIAGAIAACAQPREITKTPRSGVEQLLLSQALDRSLLPISLPLPETNPLFIEVTGLQSGYFAPSQDLDFIRDLVAGRLQGLGYRVLKTDEEASYFVRIVVQAFGTNQSSSFFGMPAVQSVLIPFALPQLTLYQNLAQDGYVRFGLDLVERASGQLYYSTPWYSGRAYHDQYTVLFFITFRSTDLDDAP